MASVSTIAKYDAPSGIRPARRVWRGRGVASTRQVEVVLYLLAISGVLLWEVIPLPWAWASPVLVAHIVGGFGLSALVLVPFWWSHRARLATARDKSRARTGRAIEFALGVLLISGIYLFFAGNDGSLDSEGARLLHLWFTLPLLGLVGLHVARASAVRIFWYRALRRGPRSGRFLR